MGERSPGAERTTPIQRAMTGGDLGHKYTDQAIAQHPDIFHHPANQERGDFCRSPPKA